MTNEPKPARREFLGASALALTGLGLTSCATPVVRELPKHQPLVRPGDTVLFQGDSITDAGRSRETADIANDKNALGNGYAWLAAAGLLMQHGAADETAPPDAKPGLRVFNRGISGHKVVQLDKRWQRDCVDLKPDVLSILIGVNDIWHSKNGNFNSTPAIYEKDYDALLERTHNELPNVRLVVCEPFVLRCGAIDDSWFPEFDEYRAAARRLANKHRATFVAFQTMFDKAAKIAPPAHWAGDGVHPSEAGKAMMAHTWLATVNHAHLHIPV
ncbi:MAG: lysophospholipase L1-like esterase [Planctomycetota bacterium]|jgi:lysophospholipase L1-like esterase